MMHVQERCRKLRGTSVTRSGSCELASSNRRIRPRGISALVLFAGFWMIARANIPPPYPPDLPVTDTTTFDALDLANTAPGVSDVPVGAGASVSSFNGNLQVGVPMSTVLSQDGKLPPIAFGLTYNGNNARQYYVRDSTGYERWLAGRSWVGLGWTGHVGRIFRVARYHVDSTTGTWNYTDFVTNFEFPDGSLFPFVPAVWNAHPNLKIAYLRDCTVIPPPPNLPACNMCGTHPYATCCEAAEGDDGTNACTPRASDPVEHYDVTFPNGTRYRLEKIVPYDYVQPSQWIRNHDRAGYYTTRITDLFGNSITIDYARTGPYPEAITAIHSTQHPEMDLTTTRCVAQDPDPTRCPAGTEGMLKEVQSVSFQGARAAPQRTRVQLSYGVQSFIDGGQTVSVPILADVTVVGSNQAQENGGTTNFKYGDGKLPYELPGWWSLEQIRTPLGAVIQLENGSWRSGSRLVGSLTADRTIVGVTRQTTYPEGLGVNDDPSGKPYFVRSWSRDFSASGCSPEQDNTNSFEQIEPDGRRTTFTVRGDPCGRKLPIDRGPFGAPDNIVTYQGNPGTALRTTHNLFDYPTDDPDGNIVQPIYEGVETIFEDDKYTCFESPGSPPSPVTRSINTSGFTRNSGRWQETVLTSSAYMPFRNGQSVARITQTVFGNAPACAGGVFNFVRGLTFGRSVEEGKGQLKRFEENFGWGCRGELLELRTTDEWQTANADPETGLPNPSNQPKDTDDLVRNFSYLANGDLQQTVASGGSGYPDGTTATNTYTTNTTWDQAQIATQESPAVTAYKLSDVTPDPGGRVWKSRDPNGLETVFDYDALGRLTEVDPPGSVEQATRTIYDSDLRHVRVITSGGTETEHDPFDSEQLFAKQELDQLGRVVQVWRAMPDWTLSTRITRYDQFDRPIFVSGWLNQMEATGNLRSWSSDVDGDGSPEYTVSNVPYEPNGATPKPLGTIMYYGTPSATEPLNPLKAAPDGLGRVRRVERADHSVTEYEYCGPHVQTTVKGIRTSLSGTQTSDAVTRQYFDALGRLVVVDAPAGSADAEYSYDPRGNLERVNLVAQLPPDPFEAWRIGAIPAGQVRTFKYDAAGRLVSRQTPEQGTELFGAVDGSGNVTDAYYDAIGNLLVHVDALGQKRGYFFKNVFDSLGRQRSVQRVRGTPSSPALSDISRLGTDGDFPSGGGGWVEGTITGNTFTQAEAFWRVVAYSSVPCIPPAPGQTSASTVLYFGNPSTCTYSDPLAAGTHAIRHAVSGVTRDDVLTFKYWRQVRQSTSNLDSFQAYVVLQSAGNDVSARRVAFKLDAAQVSFGRWQQSYEIRPGDLFSEAEWPESASPQSLYLYFVFEKGDSSLSGIGTGIAVDDVFVGRPGWPFLASFDYDFDACTAGVPPVGGEACSGGEEPSNRYKGRVTQVLTYLGDRVLAREIVAYKGLNGRPSGERHLVDWAGDGVFDEWVTQVGYTSQGEMANWTAPYTPGVDTARRYDYTYKRGYLDGLVDGTNGVPFIQGDVMPPNLSYSPAGSPSRIAFANGAETDIAFDVMQRPAIVTVKGPAPGTSMQQTLWSSGAYVYDGGGNISAIGAQRFAYDPAQRLTRAQVLPQTTNSAETVPYDVTSSYDAFGNMLSQQWQHLAGENPPPGFNFTLSYGSTPSAVSNRGPSSGNFVYDLNGALIRAPSVTGGPTSMLWDPQGRLTAFYNGAAEQQNRPTERYAYDAGGFRLIRWPESGDGRPLITLRASTGRTTTEFVADPTTAHPTMNRENVLVGGLVIAERHPAATVEPAFTANSPMSQNNAFGFAISGAESGATYFADIRTTQGFANQVGGIAPDANGVFWIPESALSSGQRNWVSVRKESATGEVYSNVVVVNYNANLTSSAANQVRSVSVSRSGTDVIIRWKVLQENGKKLRVYFHQSGAGEPVLLTPEGLLSGTTQYLLPDQSLASPCGYFDVTQTNSNGSSETGPSPSVALPPSGPMGASKIHQACVADDGGDPFEAAPEAPAVSTKHIATNFHHRDHLGSLRVVTDSVGWKLDAHDYYPFGREIEAIQRDLAQGSVSRFTVHERDLQTGLDYMVMRSKSSNFPFFSSPDLIDSASLVAPQSWNKYTYVANDPLNAIDPLGLRETLTCTPTYHWDGYQWVPDGGSCIGGPGIDWYLDLGYTLLVDGMEWGGRRPGVERPMGGLGGTYVQVPDDPLPTPDLPLCRDIFKAKFQENLNIPIPGTGASFGDILHEAYNALPALQDLLMRRAEIGSLYKFAGPGRAALTYQVSGRFAVYAAGAGEVVAIGSVAVVAGAAINARATADRLQNLGHCK